MTAPDPTPPAASTDPYVAKAQQRVLTLAEKRTVPPEVALPLIRLKLRNLIDSGACSVADKVLTLLVLDLLDVVEQVAGQVGT